MQTAYHRGSVLNRFRRYPRVRVPTPFTCSLARLESKGWFRKPSEDVGVVYDVSLRGMRVSTEAPIKPGDQVSLTLRLPKQAAPAEIAVATVRWTKDQIYGLAFRKLSQSSLSRLNKYMAISTMLKA
ncbi:MAG: PilZ domain-containing protein [Nitrospira sp.]|nr:MAG: PilZ domain-containing protein [Nitrospira sp.]